MSFGFAIGDFVAIGRLAWGLYKQCKGASAEFAEVCNEVLSIYTALHELEDEAQNEDSILNRAGKGRQKELNNIAQNCTEVLRQLESLVTRYRSLGTSQKKVWDRIKFGDEGIQVIRNKLVLHTSTLTLFLTSLGTGSLGRIEKKLDGIAAEIRAGQHELSIITAVNDDTDTAQNEAWRFLCGEMAENFSREEIEAYKGEIKSYIKKLVDGGALEEEPNLVGSDQRATHWSAPGPLSPLPPGSESSESLSTGLARVDSRWPPRPTAVSDSGSYSLDDDVSSRERELEADIQSVRRIVNPTSTTTRGTHHNAAPPSSTKPFSGLLPSHHDDIPSDQVEATVRDTDRWGESCQIGIEVGDDCCRIAAYDFLLEKAVSIPDEAGFTDMPTCVAFTEDEILVGTAAKLQGRTNLENTFSGFTCLLAKASPTWEDDEIDYKRYECASLRKKGCELMIFVPCRGRYYALVELVGILLQNCRRLAQLRCRGGSASFDTTISSSSIETETLAEAAEIAGIHFPKIVSSEVALAWLVANQQHSRTSLHKTSIMIVDVGTRGFNLSSFDILASLNERFHIRAHEGWRTNFGGSVDQFYAQSQLRSCKSLPQDPTASKLDFRPLRDVKQMGILMEGARKRIANSGKKYGEIPVLDNNKSFVWMSSRVGLSQLLPKDDYLQPLRRDLRILGDKKGIAAICVLTGELASLDTLQSLVRHFLADSPCHLLIATADMDILASKGAVELALHNTPIYETFPLRLELLVRNADGRDGFLGLSSELERGQDHIPWTKFVPLYPASTTQRGILLAIYKTNERLRGSDCSKERDLLFEVAIEQERLHTMYFLQIGVDGDCNVDFELQGCDEREHTVEGHVHWSNGGIVDLRDGKFVGVNNFIRKNWRFKR